MARIRSIKPEFFTSMTIAGLTRDTRLAFIGLWTHVDDAGRCIDEPRLLKAALFPLDDDITPDHMACIVDELENKGRVQRYQIDGRDYLQVIGWEHQKIDRRKPSNIPAPPDHDGSHTPTDPPLDPSTNDRRRIDDASSPDLRIKDQGSDLDQVVVDAVPAPDDPTPDNSDTPPEIHQLCELLADRITDHRPTGARPAITKRWTNDMRLLVERGPTGRATPHPIPPDKVTTAIRHIFDRMADPSPTGFCWADQIQSPAALRKHWDKLAQAARSNATTHTDPGTIAIAQALAHLAPVAEVPA